jgi:hypothetical protein
MTNAVIGMMCLLGFMYLLEISQTRPDLGFGLAVFVGVMYFVALFDMVRKSRR